MPVGEAVLKLKAVADIAAFEKMGKWLNKVAKQHKHTAGVVSKSAKSYAYLSRFILKAVKADKLFLKASSKIPKILTKIANKAINAASTVSSAFKDIRKAAGAAATATVRLASGIAKVGLAAAKKAFSISTKGLAALSGATALGAREFASLDNTMTKLGVVANINQTEIDKLTSALIKQSASSIFSAKETAEAMAVIGALGNFGADAAEQIQNLTEISMQLAVASGFDDMTKSAETLVGAIRTFSKQELEAAEAANILMQAANISALSMDDMGTALQFVGGRANQMGMSIEETLAALATMRNMNIDAGVASRSLSQAMGHLISPTKEGQKWMRILGIEVTDSEGKFKSMEEILGEVQSAQVQLTGIFNDAGREAEVMTEIFGEMGSRAMIPLVSSLGDMENGFLGMKEQMMEIPTDTLQNNFDRMSESMENRMKVLKNSVASLGLTIGESFTKQLFETEGGAAAIEGIQGLFTDPKFLQSISAIGDSMGKLVTTVLPILTDLFALIAPVIAQVVDLFAELLASREVQAILKDVFMILAEFLGEFMIIMKELFPVIKEVFAALRPFLPLLRLFGKLVLIAVGMLKPLLKILVVLMDIFLALAPTIMQIGSVLMDFLGIPLQIIMGLVKGFVSLLGGIAAALGFKKEAEMLGKIVTEIDNVGDAMNEAKTLMKEFEFGGTPMGAQMTFGEFEPEAPTSLVTGQELGTTSIDGGGTSTTIIIEGNVIGEEETIDVLNERLVDELTRRGGV